MVSFRTLTLALLAGLAVAAPLESEPSSALVARQSTRWNDRYIKQPFGEKAHDLGNCNYQLTFRRDGVDSRHTIRFFATYPGSSTRREISPITADTYTLSPTRSADFGLYTVPNATTYVISVHQFRGVCASGTSGNKPSAFFVRHTDNGGYTYTNDYISPAFSAPTALATLPAPPTNVRVVRVQNTRKTYTVTFTASAAATGGYYVLARCDVYAYSTGGYLQGTITTFVPAGQTTATFRLASRDILKSVAVSSQAGTDVISNALQLPLVQESV